MSKIIRAARADLFCHVIDNFGDAGIALRLAQKLARQHGFDVRLFIDDLQTLKAIAPEVNPALPRQIIRDDILVCALPLPDDTPPLLPASLVIEVLGAAPPDSYIDAMAQAPQKPVWLVYEYLSAEDWIEDCHLKPSPHPRLPLTKYFFYPGFTPHTGGLLTPLEDDRLNNAPPLADETIWQMLHLPAPAADEHRFFLFSYENPAILPWLQALAEGPSPASVLVQPGRSLGDVAAFFDRGDRLPNAGETLAKGALTVHIIPFLPEGQLNHLLAACDVNFIRGEDTLTRAILAAPPLIWHIYPQEDGAHHQKLAEFLEKYTRNASQEAKKAFSDINIAWNTGENVVSAWENFASALPELTRIAKEKAQELTKLGDAAQNMVDFYQGIG